MLTSDLRWSGLVSAALLGAAAVLPTPAAGQAWTVEGRVVDASSGAAVQNAVVTLDGGVPILTNADGQFRFEDVSSGDHILAVSAFGYVDLEQTIALSADTRVTVRLDAAPLLLDSLNVEARTIDFDGLVLDGNEGFNVLEADIVTDQGHSERTKLSGRFDLDDVYQNVPLRVFIMAFGYLPLDTTFVPDDEDRYPFALVEDPLMQTMIDTQVERLDDRSEEYHYEYQPPVDRDDLVNFQDNSPIQVVMERRYPRHVLERIGCFFFDERRLRDRNEIVFLLQNTFAKEVQRIELYEFPGIGRMFMVRIYTRGYFQRLVADNRSLSTPYMAPGVCR